MIYTLNNTIMKKTQLLICFVTLISIISCKKDKVIPNPPSTQSQITNSIPNGDFENWNNLLLQSWQTNSCPACVPAFETYIVKQDSTSYHGQFAAKFIYNNLYPATAVNKFSVSTHPTMLSAYVKYSIYGSDTVSVKIKLLHNSITVDSGQWVGTSSVNNYLQILIPITNSASQVDSAIISIHGGHKIGYPSNNSVFWIDDLKIE